MDLADILNIRGTDFLINIKRAVATTSTVSAMEIQGYYDRKCRRFLCSPVGRRRFRRDFYSMSDMRLKQHDAVRSFQIFFNGIQCFVAQSFFKANPCHDTEALGFNVDFSFLTLTGAHLLGIGIVTRKNHRPSHPEARTD